MHIVLSIHCHLEKNSGGPGATYRIGQEYEQLGHNVSIYCFDNLPSWMPARLKALVFPYFFQMYVNKLKSKKKIDVLDASTGDAWLFAILRKKNDGILLATRSYGLEHTAHVEWMKEAKQGNVKLSWKYRVYTKHFRLWEVATSLRKSDINLLLNSYDMRYAIDNLGLDPSHIYVVALGLPSYFLGLPFAPTPQERNALIKLAQVGSYISGKGIVYSAPAVNNLLNRYHNLYVSFLGTGRPRNEVLAGYDVAVHDRITVVPFYEHTELPVLLKGHHIKLFSTLSEGFGLALIEAMGCGLAPVTTSTPGPMEIVQDGHNALVIPPRSSEAIEQAVGRLVEDRVLLDRLRQNAYERAQEYSWSKIAQQAIDLYQQQILKKTHE